MDTGASIVLLQIPELVSLAIQSANVLESVKITQDQNNTTYIIEENYKISKYF